MSEAKPDATDSADTSSAKQVSDQSAQDGDNLPGISAPARSFSIQQYHFGRVGSSESGDRSLCDPLCDLSCKGRDDWVVVEEPMEIRIVYSSDGKPTMRSVSITMRTPGNDEELAAGFLFTEGILKSADQIEGFRVLGNDAEGQPTGNIVRVNIRPDTVVDIERLTRNFFTTSSCGVCGKASLDALAVKGMKPIGDSTNVIPASVLRLLPDRLREAQPTFAQTGGLHAAGAFTFEGELRVIREDVGRHNAVDKLVGRLLFDRQVPLSSYTMMISGRASFEIMQKALVAGIPIVVAVGAPSSLAVEMAREYNMTLVGFAAADRFNVYAGAERITSN